MNETHGLLIVLLALGGGWLARAYALRRALLDRPDPRRSHAGAMPRGGGVGIVAALLVWLIVLAPTPDRLVLAAAIGAIAALGAWDDHRPLPAWLRLLVQLAVSLALVASGGMVQGITFAGVEWQAPWLWSGLAVIAVVWLINLFNFMDGSHGLATGQALFTGLVFWWLTEPPLAAVGLALALAALGFLPLNFPRPRVFLGDVGSNVLGLVVAWLALRSVQHQQLSLALVMLVPLVFVVDATATLLARLIRGQRWYTPHRQHAYQRLIEGGWTHQWVWLGYMTLNVLLLLPAVWLARNHPPLDALILALAILVLLIAWRLARSQPGAEHGL